LGLVPRYAMSGTGWYVRGMTLGRLLIKVKHALKPYLRDLSRQSDRKESASGRGIDPQAKLLAKHRDAPLRIA